MRLQLMVEEPSAEAAVRNLVPAIAPGTEFAVAVFQGKQDLLGKLSQRLDGFRWRFDHWVDEQWRFLVLVDEDRQDCLELKARMNAAAADPFQLPGNPSVEPNLINRIAIEELEAWFLGDPDAVRAAFPRVPASFEERARYRSPDEISGGTAEALERLLQGAGYYGGGLAKIDAARRISAHMDPQRNSSPSFRHFREAIVRLTSADNARPRIVSS